MTSLTARSESNQIPSLTRRIPSLTGMRFVAALMVFTFHASAFRVFKDQHLDTTFSSVVSTASWVGVSFFFILSGFVLTWSHRPRDTARRFWRRRAAKIYPNHAVTWLITLLLMAWAGQSVGAGTATLNLLLVHSWVPKTDVFGSVNPVSWSLACEVFFYLSFPVLLRLVRKIRPDWLWPWAGIMVAAIFLMPVVSRLLPDQPTMPFGLTGSIWQWWFVYAFPPVRALEFVLGMIMAEIVRTGRWIRLGMIPVLLLGVVGYVAAHHVPYLDSLVAATVIPLALLIPATATVDLRGSWSPLRSKVMIYLGDISYAFYLVHYLVVYYGHLAFGHIMFGQFAMPAKSWAILPGIGMILAFLAASVLAASLLYRFVERPVMDKWSRPRSRAPAGPLSEQPPTSLSGT